MKTLTLLWMFSVIPTLWAQKTSEVMPLADQSLILSVTRLNDSLIMVGERGHVLHSDDKGQSWQQFANIPVRAALTDVTTKGSHIWIVGHDTTILHSSDTGKNWEIQFSDPDREVPLLSVYFLDENKGFAVGAYGTLLTTENGGKDWADNLISEELDYHLNGIFKTDDDMMYVAAEAGYIFKSEDMGTSWQEVELPYSGSMFGMFSMGSELVAFGLRGHVLTSLDQGDSWIEIDNPMQNNLFAAVKINDNEAVLVGANGTRLSLSNGVIKDIDDKDSSRDFSDVIKVDDKLLMVGEDGFFIQALGN